MFEPMQQFMAQGDLVKKWADWEKEVVSMKIANSCKRRISV